MYPADKSKLYMNW